MKTWLNYVSSIIASVLLLQGCSKQGDVKMGMQYSYTMKDSPYSSTVFVFSAEGVSVFDEVGQGEDICIRKQDGSILTSLDTPALRGVGAAQGTVLTQGNTGENPVEVIFGPGDRVPILQSAPYKIDGDSLVVDWTHGHAQRFDLASTGYHKQAHASSGSEVFTIKNDGLILESASSPGLVLTMGKKDPSAMSFYERLDSESEEYQRKNHEASQKSLEARQRREGQ